MQRPTPRKDPQLHQRSGASTESLIASGLRRHESQVEIERTLQRTQRSQRSVPGSRLLVQDRVRARNRPYEVVETRAERLGIPPRRPPKFPTVHAEVDSTLSTTELTIPRQSSSRTTS